MDIFRKIILSSCILSIIISIADSLKPSEKFSRQLKMIFSMIFVSGIAASALKADFKPEIPAFSDNAVKQNYATLSQTADSAAKYAAEKSLTDSISRILTSQGISFEKITADINMNEDGSINIIEIGCNSSDFEKASECIRKNITEAEVKRIE